MASEAEILHEVITGANYSDGTPLTTRGSAKDRNRHAWHLALAGLRRGEIASLCWDDVDLEQRTVRIGKTRVDV